MSSQNINNNNNNNNNEDINDKYLTSTQCQQSVQNSDNKTNNNVNNNNNSLVSFFSTDCSVPTELFNTLNPISVTQINSHSTPFDGRDDNQYYRRQVMGEDILHNESTYLVESQNERQPLVDNIAKETTIASTQRASLIGELVNSCAPIGSRSVVSAQTSVETMEGKAGDEDGDALADKVEQLLGRTQRNADQDLDDQSLGLICIISENDSNDGLYSDKSYKTWTQRSEPDGKPKTYQSTQQSTQLSNDIKKLVHYSSSESESEDNEEENDIKLNVNLSPSTSFQKSIQMKSQTISESGIRYRSYSASGSHGSVERGLQTNVGFGISSYLRQQMPQKESSAAGTQTLRSFLSERVVQQIHDQNEDNSNNYYNTSNTHSSALESHKSRTSSDEQTISQSVNPFISNKQEMESQSVTQTGYQQFIYIPTGMKKTIKTSPNGSDISSGSPLDRVLDIFKEHNSETSTKSSYSSSEEHKENKPINAQTLKHSWISSINRQNGVNKDSYIKSNSNSNVLIAQSVKTRSKTSLTSKESLPNETTDTEETISPETHFKNLVERQKNYLKCLQKELQRLEKMESKLFAKFHSCAKYKKQCKPVKHLSGSLHKDSTTPISMASTSGAISSNKSTTNKSSVMTSNRSDIISLFSETQPLNYFENIDNSCNTTAKSWTESSVDKRCHRNHRLNSHSMSNRNVSPKKKHILTNNTFPKQIQENKSTKPMNKSSKAIQTSLSLLTLEPTSPAIHKRKEGLNSFKSNERQAISWFIPIDKSKQNNCFKSSNHKKQYSRARGTQRSKEYFSKTSTPFTLQEAFNQNCSSMRAKSQMRINRINRMAQFRRQTAEERLKEVTESYLRQQNLEKLLRRSISVPFSKIVMKRVFTHQEMRAQTEKIYVNLPEVRALKEKKKNEEKAKHQRLMAHIYKYRLKENALKGKISWKITQSCLYS